MTHMRALLGRPHDFSSFFLIGRRKPPLEPLLPAPRCAPLEAGRLLLGARKLGTLQSDSSPELALGVYVVFMHRQRLSV